VIERGRAFAKITLSGAITSVDWAQTGVTLVYGSGGAGLGVSCRGFFRNLFSVDRHQLTRRRSTLDKPRVYSWNLRRGTGSQLTSGGAGQRPDERGNREWHWQRYLRGMSGSEL
jgi:hypothetical protein